MDGTRKVLVIVGAAVAIIAAGILIGILATSGREVSYTSANLNPAPPAPSAATSAPAPAMRVPQVSPQLTNPPPVIAAAPEAVVTNTPAATNDWSERLDEILGADTPERDKAKQLLAMFNQLPKDGQEEVAQHLTNLVEDDDYAPLGKFLTNSTLSEDVLDVLFNDLFNRPNALKLPLLVDIARDPAHPKASEAKDLLELYLEEDYGTNWTMWRAKAEQWVKDNPE